MQNVDHFLSAMLNHTLVTREKRVCATEYNHRGRRFSILPISEGGAAERQAGRDTVRGGEEIAHLRSVHQGE